MAGLAWELGVKRFKRARVSGAFPSIDIRRRFAYRAIVCFALMGVLAASPVRSSVYEDNPDRLIDRSVETQYSPIGELESLSTEKDENGRTSRDYGTAVIISPCLIMTNYHVVFGKDVDPIPGKDYSIKFRAGLGPSKNVAFLGNTIADPVLWGKLGSLFMNDWAVLRLRVCVGSRDDIGWFDVFRSYSEIQPSKLLGHKVAVVGYADKNERGSISFARGEVKARDNDYGTMSHSASASTGESGGGVFMLLEGKLRLVGLHVGEYGNCIRTTVGNFATWNAQCTNWFIPIYPILARGDVSLLIEHDLDAYGPNPRLPSKCFLRSEGSC